MQLIYCAALEAAGAESPVGYSVRLWTLVVAHTPTSLADRSLIEPFHECFPKVELRDIQTVSIPFTGFNTRINAFPFTVPSYPSDLPFSWTNRGLPHAPSWVSI